MSQTTQARRRLRRVGRRLLVWLVRVGVVVTALLGLAAGCSFRWALFRGHWVNGQYSTLAFERGAVTYQTVGPSLMMHGGAVYWAWTDARRGRLTARADGATLTLALRPVWDGASGHQKRLASLPMWIPVAMVGVPTWLLWRRLGRLARSGVCPACGYDLAGLAAAVPCPECGELLNA